MSPYRKRFIQFNMLLIGVVLTIMVAAVAVYIVNDSYHGLRVTMEQVVAPLRGFSQPPKENQEPPSQRPERREQRDILAVFYDPESEDYSVLSPTASFTDEEIKDILAAIAARTENFGILHQNHAIYYRSGGTAPYRIAIASTSYITHSVVRLVLVLSAIWLLAMLLFFAISVKLSSLAAKPMEEAMQREKQFVADASHDLKTPLSVILANNAILTENPDATVESVRRWVDSTQEAAKRMQLLISQMLTLAEAERPDAAPSAEQTDLAGIAMKAALEMESVAYEKRVTLETDLQETCGVRGSSDYLRRIVSSLLENALKYEPEGGRVLLTLSREKRKVSLSVRNFGTYISEEDLPHVFDRFYRSDRSRRNESGSFGLGLAIAREMAERLNGEITADSSLEDGTVFCVTFCQ